MTPDVQALLEPIFHNDVSAVRAVLAGAPALVGARDPELGSTPLHFAAHRGFVDVVDALLAAGADACARETVSDTTPLHWAAEGGHPQIVGWLLARGAPLEARDGWFQLTPLGWATVVSWSPRRHADRTGAATSLREAGAQDDIHVALVLNDADRVREIVAATPAALGQRLGFVAAGMTPLHLAARRGLATMTALLLELGADPRAQDADGLSPLALALAEGHAEVAELLRPHGIDDSARWLAGEHSDLVDDGRLLGFAAERGLAAGLRALLDAGAPVDACSLQLVGEVPRMVTPLQRAAHKGHADIVALLLAAGAEIDGGITDGAPTPLHVAAGAGHLEVVRVLLAHGADREARYSVRQATARDWAETSGHAEIVALLDAV